MPKFPKIKDLNHFIKEIEFRFKAIEYPESSIKYLLQKLNILTFEQK